MVEYRIQTDDIDLAEFYECAQDLGANQHNYDNSNESSIEDERQGNDVYGSRSQKKKDITVNFDTSNPNDARMKYDILQNRWKQLYSTNRSLRLQDAVKKH